MTLILSACQDQTSTLTKVDRISHPHGLAVDIGDPSKLYIATHEGLLLLKDETDLYRIGESTDDLMGFTVDKKDPNIFYSSGHPSFGGNIGFQKTLDGGQTWEKVSDGMNGPVDFHSMTVSPVNSDIIYGFHNGEIQKSSDGGESWSMLNKQPKGIISLTADLESEETVYATTEQGIWVSKNGGGTWEILSEMLSDATVIVLAQNPDDTNQMLSFSDTLGLTASNDGGKTWTSIANIPAVFYFISFSPSVSGLVYAIDSANQVYKSMDTGITWQKIY